MQVTNNDVKRATEIIEDFRKHCKNHKSSADFDSMIVSFFALRIAKLEKELKEKTRPKWLQFFGRSTRQASN